MIVIYRVRVKSRYTLFLLNNFVANAPIRLRLRYFAHHVLPEVGTWGEGIHEVQNVLRSAWVKTDAASKTANATSVKTRLLAASVFTHALRGTLCTPCTPQVPTSVFYHFFKKNLMNDEKLD